MDGWTAGGDRWRWTPGSAHATCWPQPQPLRHVCVPHTEGSARRHPSPHAAWDAWGCSLRYTGLQPEVRGAASCGAWGCSLRSEALVLPGQAAECAEAAHARHREAGPESQRAAQQYGRHAVYHPCAQEDRHAHLVRRWWGGGAAVVGWVVRRWCGGGGVGGGGVGWGEEVVMGAVRGAGAGYACARVCVCKGMRVQVCLRCAHAHQRL